MKKHNWRTALKSSVPLLTPQHTAARLAWANQYRNHTWTARVDIDEQWFYGVVMSGKHRLPPGVVKPRVPLQSKRFIPKAMMLTAAAKSNVRHKFDGKIGCWSIVKPCIAKRSSKNHARGEAYDVEAAMDKHQFNYMIKKKLVPSIRRKMAWCQKVVIQMDNAPPHTNLVALEQELNAEGCPKIQFVRQPPQSPDMNINDLGLILLCNNASQDVILAH